MNVSDAQREVRTVYQGGFQGQLVSGALWLLSAAAATWMSPARGIVVLVAGGFFIFPLTMLLLKIMGRPASLGPGNPLGSLAMQVAFTLPLNLPLVAAATFFRPGWFYPAFMVALGTHYLPFVFLYGMWPFAVLAGALILGGLAIAHSATAGFALGAWITGVVLILFAFWGRAFARARDGAVAR